MLQLSISETARDGLHSTLIKNRRYDIPSLPWYRPSADVVVLADASSTLCNFRSSELLIALMAMEQGIRFRSFVTGAGTIEEIATDWPRLELSTRMGFIKPDLRSFRSVLQDRWPHLDRVPVQFFPVGVFRRLPFGLGGSQINYLLSQRKKVLEKLARVVGVKMTRFSVESFEKIIPARSCLSDVAGIISDGKVLGSFPCPVCSYQLGTTVNHAIRADAQNRLVATRTIQKNSLCKCPYASALMNGSTDFSRLSIAWLVSNLGFVPGGQLTYQLLARSGVKRIAIRDYKQSRGLADFVSGLFPEICVTTRVHVKDVTGARTLSGYEFLDEVRKSREVLQAAVRQNLISQGKVVYINQS